MCGGCIPHDQAIHHQIALDCRNGAENPRIIGGQEPHLGDQQQAGIEVTRTVRLHK